MKFILLLFSLNIGHAQVNINDVMSVLDSFRLVQTAAFTVTATQGDGTILAVNKFAGTSPHIGIRWTPPSGTQVNQQNVTIGTTVQTMFLNYGDVSCFLGFNPTAVAVTVGSLAIPASSLAWSCTTDIRASGVLTGQTTAMVNGSIAWP